MEKEKPISMFTFAADDAKLSHGLVTVDDESFKAAIAAYMSRRSVSRIHLDKQTSHVTLIP